MSDVCFSYSDERCSDERGQVARASSVALLIDCLSQCPIVLRLRGHFDRNYDSRNYSEGVCIMTVDLDPLNIKQFIYTPLFV